MSATGIVAFIVVFGTIVLVHELGHFVVAKAVGILVHDFSIGLGPAVARLRRGPTTYSLRALPLGGFVRLAGMDNPAEGGGGADVLLPASDPRRFSNRPLWQRTLTIVAGPLMNFVLAGVLFAFLVVPPAIVGVEPDSPAARAGIMPGDRLVQVNHLATPTATRVLRAIQGGHPDRPLRITVDRSGRLLEFEVVPEMAEGGVRFLGIRMGGSRSAVQSLYGGFVEAIDSTGEIIRAIGRMILGREAVSVAGPAGIFTMVQQAANRGVLTTVGLAAILNVNLGLINLLPLPVLDGGWLLFMGIEWVRRRPLEPRSQSIAQVLGLMVLLALMLLATYFDLRRLG